MQALSRQHQLFVRLHWSHARVPVRSATLAPKSYQESTIFWGSSRQIQCRLPLVCGRLYPIACVQTRYAAFWSSIPKHIPIHGPSMVSARVLVRMARSARQDGGFWYCSPKHKVYTHVHLNTIENRGHNMKYVVDNPHSRWS